MWQSIKRAGDLPDNEQLTAFTPILALDHKLAKRPKLAISDYAHPRLAEIVKSNWFIMSVMFVVFVNTVFLGIEHAGQSETFDVLPPCDTLHRSP